MSKLRVNDCDIGSYFEVSDRIFNAFLVVGNDGESGNFGCSAGSRGDCAEVRLATELRDAEYLAHISEGQLRIFIFDPHSLCSINRGTAADCNDPVGLELFHCFRAAHYGFNGRIGFDTFKELHFHACFVEI